MCLDILVRINIAASTTRQQHDLISVLLSGVFTITTGPPHAP